MDQVTSYATLQSAVAGMIHRASDTNITDNLPLFIQLCEADLNDRLLLKDMESDEALTLTLNQNYVALPSGFVSPLALWLVLSGARLLLTQRQPQEMPYNSTASIPTIWAVDGANIRFDCPASAGYSAYLRCIKKSNLSASNTSNALLLKRPDVYLFGTLKQVALYTNDDAAAGKWGSFYEAAIKALKAADSRNRTSVPMRTDLHGHKSNVLTGE